MSNDITRWISNTIIESDSTWLALVFRVDGTIKFANKTKKSVWTQGCVSAFENTKCVLGWTIRDQSQNRLERLLMAFNYANQRQGRRMPGSQADIH